VPKNEKVFSIPMVQDTSMILMHNHYFVSTVNSHVDVATYSDSVFVASASNYSDVLVHACHNFEYVQKSMSAMHSGISNIKHALAYSHSSIIERIHMPMSSYHDQTNIMYPKSFHEVSYVSGPNNFQHGVSSCYSSVENSHCINQSRHMLMDVKIANLILIIGPIILSTHMLHHMLLKRKLHLHVQLHMLVSMIWPLMLVITIAELMNTHQVYTHLHMLL
jgi:hypothetical protein